MRASELRIGDWVMINDVDYPTPVQIDGIVKKHGTVYAYFAEFDIRVACEKLQGIPLTADLLSENGFYPTMEDERIYEYHYASHYIVHVQKDGDFINLICEMDSPDGEDNDLVSNISVTYGDRLAVHNLQHFLTENYINIQIVI